MNTIQRVELLGAVAACACIAGCGGGGTGNSGSGPTNPVTPASSVAITLACPSQIQIGVTSPSTYICTAKVSGTSNTAYSLALTGSGDSNRASLDANAGVLTPSETNTGSVTVTAAATVDSTKTATATVKVVDWILTQSQSIGVAIVNGDGTGHTTILQNAYTGTNNICDQVAWRPDHLAFLCDEGGPYGDGYVIDIYQTDGTAAGTTKVSSVGSPPASGGACTGGPCFFDAADYARFSPDGQTIVCMARAGGSGFAAVMGVWTVDTSGKNAPVLVYSPPPSLHFGVPAYFTPNGKQITFWNPADKTVWIVNADGTNAHQLIASESYLPAIFSPDGTALYYNGADGVYVAKPDGSSPVKILSGNISSGSGYEIVGLSANGRSVLVLNNFSDLYSADAITGGNLHAILVGSGVGDWTTWWY